MTQHPRAFLDTAQQRAHRRAVQRQTIMVASTIGGIIALIVAAAALMSPLPWGPCAAGIAVGTVALYYVCAWLENR